MEQQDLNNITNPLFEKCKRVESLPGLESQARKIQDDITYAIKVITECNIELDHILTLNQINNLSNQGMKKLEYIYNNILDQKNLEQTKRLNDLVNELKKLYRIPAKSIEELQLNLKKIQDLINQIEDFQNELSCKTLYKKPQNT